jgi:hypothetical protein
MKNLIAIGLIAAGIVLTVVVLPQPQPSRSPAGPVPCPPFCKDNVASIGPRNGPAPCPPFCDVAAQRKEAPVPCPPFCDTSHSPFAVRDWNGRSSDNPVMWWLLAGTPVVKPLPKPAESPAARPHTVAWNDAASKPGVGGLVPE